MKNSFKGYMKLLGLICLMNITSFPKVCAQKGTTVHVFVSGNDGVTEFRIPSMITLKSGTVLAVCDARVDRSGDVPNNIDQVIKSSKDNGKTWSDMKTIVDFPNQEGAADPQLLQDRITGRVFLFYTYCPGRNDVKEGPNRQRRHLSLQYIFSDNDGDTWSMPIVVEHGLKKEGWHSIWPAPGRGVQLTNGRLIVPVTVSDMNHMYTYYFYSDSNGNSWKVSEKVGTDVNEATMVELDNGGLLVNARNRTGKRALINSSDGGTTWSEVSYHEELVEPGCQGSFMRYTLNGEDLLLFSNPADDKKRRNMTIRGSKDNGRTWPFKKVIYSGPSAYSCLTILPNGKIGLLYENGEKSPYERLSFVDLDIQSLLEKLN